VRDCATARVCPVGLEKLLPTPLSEATILRPRRCICAASTEHKETDHRLAKRLEDESRSRHMPSILEPMMSICVGNRGDGNLRLHRADRAGARYSWSLHLLAPTVPRTKSSRKSRKHVKSRIFKTTHLLQLHPPCSEDLH